MNCLQYALKFWEKNPTYRIWYDSNHCINLPEGSSAVGFLLAEKFGYEYFINAFKEFLTDEYLDILNKYFNIV
jgi:hypothetical protein